MSIDALIVLDDEVIQRWLLAFYENGESDIGDALNCSLAVPAFLPPGSAESFPHFAWGFRLGFSLGA